MSFDYRHVFLLAAFVLVGLRLLSFGGFRRYPRFAIYLIASFLYLIGTVASEPLSDRPALYVSVFFALELLVNGAAIQMLLWLHYLPQRPSLRRDWPIIAAAVVIIVMELLSSSGSHWVLRFSRAAVFFRGVLGFKTFLRCVVKASSFSLGRNLTGALLGEVIPTQFMVISDTLYLTHAMPYEFKFNFYFLVHVLGWSLIAWAMWDLDAPKKAE